MDTPDDEAPEPIYLFDVGEVRAQSDRQLLETSRWVIEAMRTD